MGGADFHELMSEANTLARDEFGVSIEIRPTLGAELVPVQAVRFAPDAPAFGGGAASDMASVTIEYEVLVSDVAEVGEGGVVLDPEYRELAIASTIKQSDAGVWRITCHAPS